MPLSQFKHQKAVGYAILVVVAISALVTGVNAEVQREQSNHLDRVVSCQANVNKKLYIALNDRDIISSDSQRNIDNLIKELTTPRENETQEQRVVRAGKVLAGYFSKAKEINDRRLDVKLPSEHEFTACE